MSNIGIIIQARLASVRLPRKILLPIRDKEILWHVCNAAKIACNRIAKYPTDDKCSIFIASPDLHKEKDGSYCQIPIITPYWTERDVLREYHEIALQNKLDVIVRITGDCPMLTPDRIMQGVFWCEHMMYAPASTKWYYYNGIDGQDVEIFSRAALDDAHAQSTSSQCREHVTLWMRVASEVWTCIKPDPNPNFRSVDTPEDYEWVKNRMESNWSQDSFDGSGSQTT